MPPEEVTAPSRVSSKRAFDSAARVAVSRRAASVMRRKASVTVISMPPTVIVMLIPSELYSALTPMPKFLTASRTPSKPTCTSPTPWSSRPRMRLIIPPAPPSAPSTGSPWASAMNSSRARSSAGLTFSVQTGVKSKLTSIPSVLIGLPMPSQSGAFLAVSFGRSMGEPSGLQFLALLTSSSYSRWNSGSKVFSHSESPRPERLPVALPVVASSHSWLRASRASLPGKRDSHTVSKNQPTPSRGPSTSFIPRFSLKRSQCSPSFSPQMSVSSSKN